MKSLTIDKKKWCRGGRKGEAMLLNEKGNMCCLGFFCKNLEKVPKDKLGGNGEPDDVARFLSDESILIGKGGKNSEFTNRAISINDDRCITDSERQMQLTALFKENGIRIKFK